MGAEARTVAFVCAAEILGLAGFSLVPALLPQFIATWSLSNAEAGWLAGMMSGGYMAAVLPLVALTDRMPARTIFLVCSALNALSCFGIAFSDGLLPALVWRAVGGIAVAGMYMPGLRALTDGMAGASARPCRRLVHQFVHPRLVTILPARSGGPDVGLAPCIHGEWRARRYWRAARLGRAAAHEHRDPRRTTAARCQIFAGCSVIVTCWR